MEMASSSGEGSRPSTFQLCLPPLLPPPLPLAVVVTANWWSRSSIVRSTLLGFATNVVSTSCVVEVVRGEEDRGVEEELGPAVGLPLLLLRSLNIPRGAAWGTLGATGRLGCVV